MEGLKDMGKILQTWALQLLSDLRIETLLKIFIRQKLSRSSKMPA